MENHFLKLPGPAQRGPLLSTAGPASGAGCSLKHLICHSSLAMGLWALFWTIEVVES